MKLFKYTLLGLLSAVALATVAKEQLVTLLRNGEVVATFKSSNIWTMGFRYQNSIYPVNEKGENINSVKSWNKEMNTAIFAIEPKELLDEYTPTYELSENLEPYAYNGKVMEVDKVNGLVYVYFSTPRKAGRGSVTVTLGEGDEAEKGVLQVVSYPEIQSVTFYGPTAGEEIASRPYLDQRPGLGLERQYWALVCEKTISLNQEDEIRVAVNVAGGEMEDILEAVKCCRWFLSSTGNPIEDTNKLKILENSYEIVEGHGFDAILKVSSVGMGDEELIFGPCLNEMGTYDYLFLTYHVKGRMHAVDVNGEEIEYKRSWNLNTDRALFACDRALLEKYTPTYRVEGDIEITNMWVNKDEELIYVEFSSPRKAGHGDIIVSIGEGAETQEAKLTVYMYPTFSFVSFYGETAGPDINSLPYLYSRPALGTMTMYMATKCEKIIDINSEDEVRVAMNIYGGADEDIREATKCYEWKQVSGDALVVTRDDSEIVPYNGFDAIIGVRSGMKTGKVVFECKTPCFTEEDPDNPVTLTLTYNVVNIKKDYPIREIILDNDNVTFDINEIYVVKMSVEPMESYAYQKVKVEVADPTVVRIMNFEGSNLPIQGLKPGTTTVKFTAYNDTQIVEKTMTVTVNDPVGRVVIDNSGDTYIFAGGTTTWKANAYSLSGVLMSNVELTWASANTNIATVANGVVTGVAVGSANITAACGDVVSGVRAVRVVAAPNAINAASDFQGFYEDGDNIVFLDNSDGYLYIPGGYANGEFVGTYNLSGAYYLNSDAHAPATGTITIAKGAGEYEYIVTMNVNINLSSSKVVRFAFNNGIIEYLPA